jgi:hypothetical protein
MEVEEKKKNKYSLLIILGLMAILVYLAIVVSQVNNNNHDLSEKIKIFEFNEKQMIQSLRDEGIISDDDNQNLKSNLNTLLLSYDSLEQTNTLVIDSINIQREKITSLMNEVSILNSKSERDWGKIYKLKKEAETLRGIMKGYIHTIDSLNSMNVSLQNTLTEQNNTLNKVTSENKEFKKHNESLMEKVALGAVLQAGNLKATALRIRPSGKQTETTRASRTNMIKGCCTLIGNQLAEPGNKDIFIRVLSKEGEVFSAPSPIFITDYENNKIEVSAKRSVNYQNKNTDLCVFYEMQSILKPNSYKIEVYAEGFLIGATSFALQ